MDLQLIEKYIAADNLNAVEDAWLAAIEGRHPAAQMQQTLDLLVAAGKADVADTLAMMLLSECSQHMPPAEALDVARTVLPAVKGTAEMRTAIAALYRQVHGQTDNFADFLRLSGLELTQSLRRAIRTLDLSLAATPGQHLINRFDHRAAKLDRFDPVMEQFELVCSDGERVHLEPKLLADEFEPAGADDFRVLAAFDRERLSALCQDDPAAILMAVCSYRGGKLTADQFKDTLCPRHVKPENWAKWWTRARTAAKRCPQLSIEGRSPVTVSYHPGGRTLEDELQRAVDEAKVPLELLGILRQYARELTLRRQEADPAFTGPVLAKLASQAEAFLVRRPADSLIAALALAEAQALALPALPANPLTPAMVIANMPRITERIASLTDAGLQRQAIDAMAARPDAPARLAELMRLLPSDRLDDIAARLRAAGHEEAVEAAVAEALTDPERHLQICIWLWRGPAQKPLGAVDGVDMLSRLLQAMQDLANDHEMPREARRVAFEQVRWALTGDDCRAFREVVKQVPEAVAATLKRRVERNPGLTDVNRERMLAVVREEYYTLFLKGKVEPWADEGILWATEPAIKRRREELKHLQEIELPENSRAIGVAAAKGDLSENSEWQFAVEEQRRLNSRLAQIQSELAIVRPLTVHDVPADSVGIGSHVTLTGPDGDVELTILGPWESDAANRVYSYQTPVALSLLGHAVGENLTVTLDGGQRQCTIVNCRPWI